MERETMTTENNSRKNRTVEVRLVTTHYHNRLEWEDGPGSLQNVVSDARSTSERLGKMSLAQAEAMTKSKLDDEFGIILDEDSGDGFEEFSFKLEYLDPDSGKW